MSTVRVLENPRVLAVLSLALYAPARLYLSRVIVPACALLSSASHNLSSSSDGEHLLSMFDE